MKTFFVVALALCALAAVAHAQKYYGVDVSDPVTLTQFNCIKANTSATFAIVRCGRSTGTVDPACNSNLVAAQAAGLKTDAYIFPCPKCSGGDTQVKNTIAAFGNGTVGRLWFDIEQGPKYWGAVADNVVFFKAMVGAAMAASVSIGVYTSSTQWAPIMGTLDASTYPLWYSHYDNMANFSDFKPFGGWNVPMIKQFTGDATVCGIDLDINVEGAGATSMTSTSTTSGTTKTATTTSGTTKTATTSGTTKTTNSGTTGTTSTTKTATTTSGTTKTTNSGTTNSGTNSNSNSNSGYTTSMVGEHSGAKLGGGRGATPGKLHQKDKKSIVITEEDINNFEF